MRKIVSRGLETSLALDDVWNASEICLEHISSCCYTESPNIYRENFQGSLQGSKPLPKHFPTDTWKSQAIQAKSRYRLKLPC